MDKIIYRKITSDDNLVLVVQALIDKQAELVEKVSELDRFIKGLRCLGEKQGTIK